jgi:DNA polymerase-1
MEMPNGPITITLDLETSGLDPFVDRIHLVVYRIVGVSERPICESLESFKERLDVRRLLSSPDNILRGHNIKFDALFLVVNGVDVNCRLDDTRVLSYLNWPSEKHDLKSLVETKLKRPVVRLEDFGIKPAKGNIERFRGSRNYVEIDGLFFAKTKLTKYAIADVVNCDELKKRMSVSAWWRDYEMPLTKILFDMEKRGIALDSVKLEELNADYTRRVESLKAYFGDINPGSTKQLAARLTEEGFDLKKLAKKTDKGAPKLDKLFFKNLAWTGNEFAKNILQYRKLSKNLSTYVQPFLLEAKKGGRIHGSINQAGAEDFWGEGKGGTSTGRLTSSNPNLQNIPARTPEGKAVRSCFIASKGFKLFDADLKQIEPRLVAHYTQAPKLLKAYADGMDTHGMFAADIFKTTVDKLSKTERFIGKTSWLATVYGCSYKKLLQICETFSEDPLELNLEPYQMEWEKLHEVDRKKILRWEPLCDEVLYAKWMFFKNVQEAFKAANPEIMGWRSYHITRTRMLGFVTTLGGRRIKVDGLNSFDRGEKAQAERQAVNYLIQGSAADVMKMCLVKMDERFVKTGMGHLLATVHDEILGEYVDNIDGHVVESLVHDVMCNTVKLKNVSIDSDTKLINNWSEK